MKSDRQATEARHFKSPKSYVSRDGRDVLLGKEDWDDRKKELWDRAEGRCEYTERLKFNGLKQRCSREGQIPAHIIPRKDITQRDDRLTNLMLYCIEHDRLTEKQAWRTTRFTRRDK